MTKSCECAGIHNHQKEITPNSQEMEEWVSSQEYRNFGGKNLEVHGVQYQVFQSMVRTT